MINRIAIAVLAAAVLGFGVAHRADAIVLLPYAQAVDEITNLQIITTGGSFAYVNNNGSVVNAAAGFCSSGCSAALPPPMLVSDTISSAFVGTFPMTSIQATATYPLGSPYPPGATASAFVSAGNPFTPLGGPFAPLAMNAVAEVQGCCGGAAAAKEVSFTFTVTGGPATMQLSFTDSISLITSTPPGYGAFASVGGYFGIDSLVLPELNASLNSFTCGPDCTTTEQQFFLSPVVSLSPGIYTVFVDPTVQAATVFEPSSMLLLGSGLAGLRFAARRRKLRN